MGKKDASQNRGTPVEQYRKTIGKQHVKSGKRDLQALKNKKDAKESAIGMKEVILLLSGFSLVVGSLYLFLYVWLKDPQSADNGHPE